MSRNSKYIYRLILIAGVLGSGMMFSAFAGGTINVWGGTQTDMSTIGTPGSLVEYRNLTLNKNIGNTNLDSYGEYQLSLDFGDSSGIEYDMVDVSEVKNINLYNYLGQNIGDISARNFNPNQLSSSVYFYKLNLKDGNNFVVKSNILEGDMNVPKNIPADKIAVPKGKGKTNYDIQVKITSPAGEFENFCDTLNWYIPESGDTRWEYPTHYLKSVTPVPKNYVQGYVNEMMTGNPIANLPVKFVKVLEKNPFGEEFKFVFDVLAETTTDASGYYKTNAIDVQDSVFAMIGDKNDEWMDTEHVDVTWVTNGLPIPDSLDTDHNRIVFTKMDGFVSYLPMHVTTDLDSLEISRSGSKFVNYALYPNWENIAVRDTIPSNYIVATDVVLEQNDLGKPLDKLHNGYYVSGRENKCAKAFRDDVPFQLYLVPGQFNENQINYIKETMLQASMLETGMTRDEAQACDGGFAGRYRFITEDPDVTGDEPAMRVVAGPNVYHHGEIADNPSSGYPVTYVDDGNYAEISTTNPDAIAKELGSNVARNYTAYTIGLANTMTSGHKKVDQMFIPMETKFYQLQKTGANNATMNELIGKYYKFDY